MGLARGRGHGQGLGRWRETVTAEDVPRGRASVDTESAIRLIYKEDFAFTARQASTSERPRSSLVSRDGGPSCGPFSSAIA